MGDIPCPIEDIIVDNLAVMVLPMAVLTDANSKVQIQSPTMEK